MFKSSHFITSVLTLILSANLQAKNLKDYSPYEYDVRFTNPICKTYEYDGVVKSRSGKILKAKPKNAYCSNADSIESAKQETAPLRKILEWIDDKDTKEIFFTYLSFSNDVVLTHLCDAVRNRNVKITFVLDQETELRAANKLVECKSDESGESPTFIQRGHVSGLGFAHNKIFMVNPDSKKEIKIAFGSGNMTSGIVLHHENWHFITTSPKSYFAQAHICVMNGEIEHADSGKDFRAYMKECLGEISNEPEEDIQPFFVPGDGKAATEKIVSSLEWSKHVGLAAHRFSYTTLISALSDALEANSLKLNLVFDDDIFWAGEIKATRPNMPFEYGNVKTLEKLGADIRFVETNYNSKLLHHNKFMIFHEKMDGDGMPLSTGRKATFVGAGNFTGDAFEKNLENFYYVTTPEVVDAMTKQYFHLFHDLGTKAEDLPANDETP